MKILAAFILTLSAFTCEQCLADSGRGSAARADLIGSVQVNMLPVASNGADQIDGPPTLLRQMPTVVPGPWYLPAHDRNDWC